MNKEKSNISFDPNPWPFDPVPDRNGEPAVPGN